MRRLLVLLPFAVLSCAMYPAASGEGVCAGVTRYIVMPSSQHPDCAGVASGEAAADSVADSLGLEVPRAPAYLTYAEEGDGHSFPPDQYQRGYSEIYAATLCADEDGAATTKAADFDFRKASSREVICHERIHLARRCNLFDHVFVKLDDGGTECHGFFCENHVDQMCSAADVPPVTLSGASGGN